MIQNFIFKTILLTEVAISLTLSLLIISPTPAQDIYNPHKNLNNFSKQKKPSLKVNPRQIVRNALELSAQTGFTISIDTKILSSSDDWKINQYISTLSPQQQDKIVTWYQSQDGEAYLRQDMSKGKILVVPVKYLSQAINMKSKCPFREDLCLDLNSLSKLFISDKKIIEISKYATIAVNKEHKVVIFITDEYKGDYQRFENTFKALSMSPIVRDKILLLQDSWNLNTSEQQIKRALELSEGKDTNIYGTIILDARRTKIGENE
ncbi:MAG: hypothetical protein DSM106950_33385 [Stigonema ocellatum SAG 48.90 = DSM 106950]|nr:hypothetical protein [Stigonema ocellatum SAG 48.90 = DSM 106950]